MLACAQKASRCAQDGGMGRERRQDASGCSWALGIGDGGVGLPGRRGEGKKERERQRERGSFHTELPKRKSGEDKSEACFLREE